MKNATITKSNESAKDLHHYIKQKIASEVQRLRKSSLLRSKLKTPNDLRCMGYSILTDLVNLYDSNNYLCLYSVFSLIVATDKVTQ